MPTSARACLRHAALRHAERRPSRPEVGTPSPLDRRDQRLALRPLTRPDLRPSDDGVGSGARPSCCADQRLWWRHPYHTTPHLRSGQVRWKTYTVDLDLRYYGLLRGGTALQLDHRETLVSPCLLTEGCPLVGGGSKVSPVKGNR
jgi:hypothetical protein